PADHEEVEGPGVRPCLGAVQARVDRGATGRLLEGVADVPPEDVGRERGPLDVRQVGGFLEPLQGVGPGAPWGPAPAGVGTGRVTSSRMRIGRRVRTGRITARMSG